MTVIETPIQLGFKTAKMAAKLPSIFRIGIHQEQFVVRTVLMTTGRDECSRFSQP
jgi:hypothetical protein